MGLPTSDFSRRMRLILILSGLLNTVGGICFTPPVLFGRQLIHLPEPPSMYLWLLSSCILSFGLSFFYQAWTGHANATVLLLATWGKGLFAVLLIRGTSVGELPLLATAAAIPDLVNSLLFAGWLWRNPASFSARFPYPNRSETAWKSEGMSHVDE